MNEETQVGIGGWAKRLYFADRAVVEAVLRPFDLGSTQWAVLQRLAEGGPTSQRAVGIQLHLERATLSGVVTTLVRKELVAQVADPADQRQRLLALTDAGSALWTKLPDPFAEICELVVRDTDPVDVATTIRVLIAATRRVEAHLDADGSRGR